MTKDSALPSAARYLEECLPKSEYWDAPVEQQTEDVTAKRVMEFLGKVGATPHKPSRLAARSSAVRY